MSQLRRRPDAAAAPSTEPVSEPPAVTEEAPRCDLPVSGGITDCALYEPSGRRAGRLPIDGAAQAARECDGFVWIGMHEPSPEQFAAVVAEFALPQLAVDDALVAHQRPKLELYGDLVFTVLKPVRYVDSQEVVDVGELAFFLGRDFVVTVRHGVERRSCATCGADLDAAGPELLDHGPTAVLYRAADRIVDGYEVVAAHISVDVEEIEAQVFGGEESDHSQRIYRLKREVLEFRRAVRPAGACRWSGSPTAGSRACTPRRRTYFRDVHDHVLRAIDAIEGHDRHAHRRAQRRPRAGERPAEPHGGPAERGHAQDLRVGGDRAGAHGDRRHLRHELREHAGAALGVRLLLRARADPHRVRDAAPALPPQRLALSSGAYAVGAPGRTPA